MNSTDKTDINAAINAQKALMLTFPEGTNEHLDAMENLSNLYLARFEYPPCLPEDLGQAIDIRREICRFTASPPLIHRHFNSLYRFSFALQRRYCPESKTNEIISVDLQTRGDLRFRDDNDLDELISTQQAALKLCPPEHSLYLLLLTQLGSTLLQRGESLAEDVEAIHMLRSALLSWPVDDVHRLSVLKNVALGLRSLVARSEHGEQELGELVDIYREIADHHSPTVVSRIESLMDAARCTAKLCEICGGITPWTAVAYELGEEILGLSPNNQSIKELVAQVQVYEEHAMNGPDKLVGLIMIQFQFCPDHNHRIIYNLGMSISFHGLIKVLQD